MKRAYVEAPVVFGRDNSLVGLTCEPSGTVGEERPWVIFLNAGVVHRTGPNRLTVHLARALAEAGVPSLRFDLSGIGDSVFRAHTPAQPVQERVQSDIDEALDFARAHCGARKFVLSGLCSGADNALRAAKRSADIVGLVLLDLNVARTRGYYLRHYGRRLLRADTWRNVLTGRSAAFHVLRDAPARTPPLADDAVLPPEEMRAHLRAALERDVRLLCVFTAGIASQYNYEHQFADIFPELDLRHRVRVLYFGEADHTFTDAALQQRMCAQVVSWVAKAESVGTVQPVRRAGAPAVEHAGGL